MARELVTEAPVVPIFRTIIPNSRIEFGEFEIVIREKDKPDEPHNAVMFMDLEKSRSVRLEVTSSKRSEGEIFRRIAAPIVDELAIEFHKYGTSATWYEVSATQTYSPRQSPIQVFKPCDCISRTTFHLFNWPRVIGPESVVLSRDDSSGRLLGKFTLIAEGWKIVVGELEEADSLWKNLGRDGIAITYCGTIERDDGRLFSSAELNDIIELLTHFFGFFMGRWMGPSLTVGVDSGGNTVFQHCGLGLITPGKWYGDWSCFDSHHTEILTEAFPGFCKRWMQPDWKRALHEAIYWYAGANSAGRGTGVNVDGAIMFSQAALELLAWTYCVIDRNLVSKRAFGRGGLIAADKIRLLATSLGIPLEIPAHFSELHNYAKVNRRQWTDLADALTDLRNALVHPVNEKSTESVKSPYLAAWRLSMWLIEMMILAICGYSGNISNRSLEVRYGGQVTPVPWGNTSP